MQVEVWSDVVCPWCYIGKRRLEAALERFPHRDEVEVVWRSFQLDPTIPEGETHATLPALAAKYGASVEQMRANMTRVEQVAAEEGLEYHLADGVSGNTSLAHELLHHAAEHGRQGELKERLLHAHFTEARSVFDLDSLVELDGQTWRFVDTAGLRKRVRTASGMEYYASLRTRSAIAAIRDAPSSTSRASAGSASTSEAAVP